MTDISTWSADKLVLTYRKIRAVKDAKEEAHKGEIAELRTQMDLIEERLLEICNEQDANSLSVKNGTVVRTIQTRYWTSDWDSFYDFVSDHDAFELLEKRINNNNMKQFLEENPEFMPVGLNTDSKYKITVRKPHGK